MNYFLAPRSGEKSYENFLSTIKHGVPYQRIAPYLADEGKVKVLAEEVIYAWGNREGTSSYWKAMQYGDTVIFYAKGRLVMAGEVYYKQHSPQLALAMWPPDDHGNPWEYTFFLKNLRPVSIPMTLINRLANFKPNYIIQGFRDIAGERLDGIVSQYGSFENLLSDFADQSSDEIPLSHEPVYVNLSNNIIPEVINNPKILLPQDYLPKEKTNRTPYKIDYAERNRTSAITGSKGEVLVFDQEKRRLQEQGRQDLAQKVERVSLQDDALGFDVLSFEQDGRERPIEVKTSAKVTDQIRFYITSYEYNASSKLKNYNLYFVDRINKPRPRISIFPEPFKSRRFKLSPDTYLAEGVRA